MRMTPLMIVLLSLPTPAMAQGWMDQVLASTRLPVAAADARDAGVPSPLVQKLLDGLRRSGLPPEDGVLVLQEETRVVREGGPKDNFGAFVQSQLDAGLRGQELSAAIREEHRRMGVGHPNDKGPGNKPGKADAPGRAQPQHDATPGKPDAAPGKPDAAPKQPGKPPKDTAQKGRGGKP